MLFRSVHGHPRWCWTLTCCALFQHPDMPRIWSTVSGVGHLGRTRVFRPVWGAWCVLIVSRPELLIRTRRRFRTCGLCWWGTGLRRVMLRGRGFGRGPDWWQHLCLGIWIVVCGQCPFWSVDRKPVALRAAFGIRSSALIRLFDWRGASIVVPGSGLTNCLCAWNTGINHPPTIAQTDRDLATKKRDALLETSNRSEERRVGKEGRL